MESSHRTERGDSALDALEHELYNPKNKIEDVTLHSVRDRRALDLPTSWGDNSPIITRGKEDAGMSFGVKLLLFSIVLLFCALGFTAWGVLSQRNTVSSANVDMALDITPYTEGGEAVPLTFTLLNRNASPLQNAVITLVYKQGTGSQDEEEKVHEKRELGTINPNDNKRQDFSIILYGGEAEQRDIVVKLEYNIAGSSYAFSKTITASTVLKTPPIAVHIDSPQLLSIGQNGTFVITVKNNSATTSLPSVLQVTLPNSFTTVSQEPKASSRSPIWSIPSIAPGESFVVTVVGSLSGAQGETTSMRAIIGSEGDSKTTLGVVYSSQTVDIKLRSSPLNFVITLDTESGAIDKLRYGDRATLTITYANTSDIPLQDVVIKTSILGDAPLIKKVDPTTGYYDSEKRVITWDKNNLPELATLAPHSNGTLRVIVPIAVSGTNSPSLKVNINGVASTQETDDVTSNVSKTWVVQGSATISAQTTYKNSPFVNSGPIPPVPNTETTYSAHFSVSAQNALANTRVSFILPNYVTWRNVISDQANVSFDARSRTVTWTIDTLDAEKTTSVDVGLSVKPSQSQVGNMPPITSGIILEADEQVSHAHIRTTISPLTTFISGENWSVDPSRVVEN